MALQLLLIMINVEIHLIKREGKIMSLITVLVTLVIVGVILWLINSYIPMDGKIKKILNVVVVIVVILWLLSAFGVIGSLSNVNIGDMRIRK